MTKSTTTPGTKTPAKPRTARKTPARAKPATAKRATAKKSTKPAATPGVIRRNAVPLAGAVIAGAAAAAALFFTRVSSDLPEGHAAPDLETGEHPGAQDRADPHFRPDMDAPLTAEDRAALAPALAPQT
ncbi:hypothetical protein [Sphingomonas sp. LT1P40]|uniref:hypothetical protein n=1 Tax=Alteristakelama amylovorans TaxID=3096166 RepID=UPI002FCCB0CC